MKKFFSWLDGASSCHIKAGCVSVVRQKRRYSRKPFNFCLFILGALSTIPSSSIADVILQNKFTWVSGDCGFDYPCSLATYEESVVVGLPILSQSLSGAIDIFDENAAGSGYNLVDSIEEFDQDPNALFGTSVAIISARGGEMVVGMPNYVGAGAQDGGVQLYRRDASGNWGVLNNVFPFPLIDNFGSSLAMTDDTLIVGGIGHFIVYTHPDLPAAFCGLGCWGEKQIIQPTIPFHRFPGFDFSAECERFVFSSPDDTTGTLFGGAVYVYGYDALGDSWDEEQVLYSPENPAIYMFGNSDPGGVALTCDHVAVSESINRKVYIFNTTNYSIEAELSEPGTSFYYGKSIDLFGDKLVVSDPYHDTGRGGQGVVYYYHRVGANNWQLVATFAPPDNLGFIEFGANVHISDGNRLFIVAPQVDAVYYVDLDDYPVPVTLPLLTPLGYAALSVMLMAIGLGTLRSKRK